MNKIVFEGLLRQWYELNKRDLPWRRTNDPYKIWISEILLQQTRVKQGLPYYERFIKCFPTVKELAIASEKEVLRQWQGLGYYSRARNLHHASKQINEEYNGTLPKRYHELLKLKGIGPYTAAAIASIAFDEKVAVVDGNVYRVLARVFGIETDINSGNGNKEFAALAQSLVPDTDAGIYNQSVMEFGALHCTPVSPQCDSCPLENACFARQKEMVHLLPVKLKNLKKKNRFFFFLIFRFQGKFLLRERVENDIWKGLYEYYLIEGREFYTIDKIMDEEKMDASQVRIEGESKVHKNILTHQNIFSKFYLINIESQKYWKILMNKYHLEAYDEENFEKLPKSVLISKNLDSLCF